METQQWNMVSEVELIYRSKIKVSDRIQVKSSKEVAEFLKQNWDAEKIELLEEFKAIFMNSANRIIGFMNVSVGGVNSTVVDPRILFATALKLNANTIIVAHNHPSGNIQPSERDRTLTAKLVEAGRLLEIKIIDHFIITTDGHYSFADEGLI